MKAAEEMCWCPDVLAVRQCLEQKVIAIEPAAFPGPRWSWLWQLLWHWMEFPLAAKARFRYAMKQQLIAVVPLSHRSPNSHFGRGHQPRLHPEDTTSSCIILDIASLETGISFEGSFVLWLWQIPTWTTIRHLGTVKHNWHKVMKITKWPRFAEDPEKEAIGSHPDSTFSLPWTHSWLQSTDWENSTSRST